MKKVLLTIAATAFVVSTFAQGTVQFNIRSSANGVRGPIYGVNPDNTMESRLGNTTAGTPAGTQTYPGAVLSGTQYLAQLLAASGANQAESSLLAASTPPSTFTLVAGYVDPVLATLTGVARDASVATMQVVAWDNTSGLYPTWADAKAAWEAGAIAAGKSALFNVSSIGGDFNTPPYLVGFESFNIYYIPEPSTMALLGLGAAALLIFRRRK